MATGTNLTRDANFSAVAGGILLPYLALAGEQFFRGQIVCADPTTGKAQPVPANDGATDNTALKILGQVTDCPADVAVDGDKVVVRTDVVVEVNNLTLDPVAQDAVPDVVYAASDNEVTPTGALNPKLGQFQGFGLTGLPMVYIPPLTQA